MEIKKQNNGGKHLATNHPRVNNKGALILASTVLIGSLVAYSINKADNNSDNNEDNTYSEILQSQDVYAVINGIKAQYNLIDDNGLTFEGLVFKYFEERLQNVPEDEKIKAMNDLLQNPRLYQHIYSYVMANSPIKIREINFIYDENAKKNIEIITKNEELMGYIESYCESFGDSVEKVIALIAHNIKDGNINRTNPMGVNESWYFLDSKYTVYNYDSNVQDSVDLRQFKSDAYKYIKYAIGYNIMVSQSSVKQAGGNIVDSIYYILCGPSNLNISDTQRVEVENRIDEVLSYAMVYMGKDNITLTSKYALFGGNSKDLVERVQSKEYTFNTINQIITELNVSLTNTYGKSIG